MRRIDLKGQQWLTLGVKGAGKSYFTDSLMQRASGKVVIFDPMDEYSDKRGIYRIVPSEKRGEEAIEQLRETIEFIETNQDEISYFVVDEISRFHQKGGILDDALGQLLDLNRHMDIGIGFIARRPTQVHTDIREMADYLFLFGLRGANDQKMLNEISSGLESSMTEMIEEYPAHSFITVYPSRKYEIMEPISW